MKICLMLISSEKCLLISSTQCYTLPLTSCTVHLLAKAVKSYVMTLYNCIYLFICVDKNEHKHILVRISQTFCCDKNVMTISMSHWSHPSSHLNQNHMYSIWIALEYLPSENGVYFSSLKYWHSKVTAYNNYNKIPFSCDIFRAVCV